MKRAVVDVTDHAVLRYLEPIHNIDVEFYRREVSSLVNAALLEGARSVVKDGFRYMIVEGRVVTVMPNRPPVRPKRKG